MIALTATTLPCAVQPMMRLGVGVVGLSSVRDRHNMTNLAPSRTGGALFGRTLATNCRPRPLMQRACRNLSDRIGRPNHLI